MSIKLLLKPIQDNDGDWYWIPTQELEDFTQSVERMSVLEYMEDTILFDQFEEKFSKYRTGGDMNNMPEIIRQYVNGEADLNTIIELPLKVEEPTGECNINAPLEAYIEIGIPDAEIAKESFEKLLKDKLGSMSCEMEESLYFKYGAEWAYKLLQND